MIPQPQGWTPDQILTTNRSQWMVLDMSYIDMTGEEFDKRQGKKQGKKERGKERKKESKKDLRPQA